MNLKPLKQKKLVMLITILLALSLYNCESKRLTHRLIGVKVYTLDENYNKFVNDISEIGINTVFAGKELSKKNGFIKTLQNHGIKVFTIWPVFFNPDTLKSDSSLYAIDQYGNKADDDWVKFTCHSRKLLRKHIVNEIYSYVKKFKPNGISLDFIRHFVYWEKVYPNTNPDSLKQTCYCDSCIANFTKSQAIKFADSLKHNEIVNLLNTKYNNAWINWRVQLITSMVEAIVKKIHLISPDIKINIHIVPWRTKDFKNAIIRIAGQDVAELSKYSDYISPMCYSFMVKQSPEWINSVVSDMHKVAPGVSLVPSIQVKEEYLKDTLTDDEFSENLTQALKKPSSGVIFYSWEALCNDKAKLAIVKKILTQK